MGRTPWPRPAQLFGRPWPLDNHTVHASLRLILFTVLPDLHVRLLPCPPPAHTHLSQPEPNRVPRSSAPPPRTSSPAAEGPGTLLYLPHSVLTAQGAECARLQVARVRLVTTHPLGHHGEYNSCPLEPSLERGFLKPQLLLSKVRLSFGPIEGMWRSVSAVPSTKAELSD